MDKFISCDWGTSTLRLRLVDSTAATILAETTSEEGIAMVFERWKEIEKEKLSEKEKEEERLAFYRSVLSDQIVKLGGQAGRDLAGIPVIISGMASSNIGMIELPYKQAPFDLNVKGLNVRLDIAPAGFDHPTLLVSGVRTVKDVVRGEETQLTGCINDNEKGERLFIFPGTHSKHVLVQNGRLADIRTYMTGEFFGLLSKKSILANSVRKSMFRPEQYQKQFEEGVSDGLKTSLLHSAFWVRTNDLFNELSKEENYHYLNGLVISTELKELINVNLPITIVASKPMLSYYCLAMEKIGMLLVDTLDASEAVIAGQRKIYELYRDDVRNSKF
jgi:2-dehydro-3-deoxygalactonokinase